MNSKLKRGLLAGLMGAALLGLPFFVSLPVQAKIGVDKQAVEKAPWQMLPPYDRPFLDVPEGSDTIMGPATVSQAQMVRFIRQRNANPKLNAPLEDVVQAYYDEAGREGIRPDVALCQALKETGYFAYGGDVSPEQNNFCGLGATGNGAPEPVLPRLSSVSAPISSIF